MKSLLIRAEDKNRWERRSPLVPGDLKQLIKEHKFNAFVEKSQKRFFTEEEFKKSGAQICRDMTPGDVILGVKEIPTRKILDDKVYIFFSHTIKAQKYNMGMLRRIIESGSTLIDYERIANEQEKRLVYFGNFAGDAGAINILWLMGEYWKHKGIQNPFSHIKQALTYHSVAHAKEEIHKVGKKITRDGFAQSLFPMVIGILGYGNVATGARQIFDQLPVEYVEPDNLKSTVEDGNASANKVYICIFKEKHLVENKDGKSFDLQEYYHHPENFRPIFEPYLPYINILVNAIYWTEKYPRFVTWEALEKLAKHNPNYKLNGISDITCDTNGAIQSNVKTTDSGMPAYRCMPLTRTIEDSHKGEGIVLLAIDNLPAELPNDSSTFFSRQLKPFIPNILSADYKSSLETSGLLPEVKKAVIVYNGKLTENYQYLEDHIK